MQRMYNHDKVGIRVYSDCQQTRGSINANQAKSWAEKAKESAELAEQYAEQIGDAIEQIEEVIDQIEKFKDKNYVHEQNESSAEWIINHNLGKYPTVTVVDSAGTEVVCEVTHVDTNTCIVTMKAPFKGNAILN